MPRIKTFTAQGGPGTIQARTVSPNSFGAQAFQGISDLGKGFEAVGEKIQHAQDQLDLAKVAGEYETGLDAIKSRVVLEPDLSKHGDLLADQTQKLQDAILKDNPNLSSAVQTTFQSHANRLFAATRIEVAHEGAKVKVQRAIADFTATQDTLTDRAASAPTLEQADQHLLLLDDLRNNMVRQGLLSPQDALNYKDSATNRYWSLVAQKDPNRILGMLADQAEGATHIAGMDNEKFSQYVNLAVSTMHARQLQSESADKAAEAQIKRVQAVNANLLTADLLEGKPVTDRLPALLRARAIDDTVARTLADTQTKMNAAPDPAKYQKGLAAETEARLTKAKYDNQPFASSVQDGITDAFLHDRINKEEYGHLMSVYRSVDDYKHQAGKEQANQDVTHANANLKHELRTTGPADKYDALSEQTIVSADQFYWRKIAQNPNADPWQVAKEASTIFKPVIEKRFGVSKTDQAVLDDARMLALLHSKAITPAAHKAYMDKTQDDRGWRAVQEAQNNLPPPPKPGVIERMLGLIPSGKKAERKPAGVMGGD